MHIIVHIVLICLFTLIRSCAIDMSHWHLLTEIDHLLCDAQGLEHQLERSMCKVTGELLHSR